MQVTFDGEPLQPPDSAYLTKRYFESGVSFGIAASYLGSFGRTGAATDGYPDNGSAYIQGAGSPVSAYAAGGARFDLVSVDLAEYSTVVPDAVAVPFLGYRSDGTVVSTSFTTDGVMDGNGPLDDFQTFRFDNRFAGLKRLEIGPPSGWSLDNLMVVIHDRPTAPLLRAVQWGSNDINSHWKQIPTVLSPLVSVAVTGGHRTAFVIVLQENGTMDGWYAGGYLPIPEDLIDVVAVAASRSHGVALTSDGAVVGWQDGHGKPPAEVRDVIAVAAGHYFPDIGDYPFTYALQADGTIFIWTPLRPLARVMIPGAVAIRAGENGLLVLKSEATVVWEGSTENGLGDIPPEATGVVGIACGEWHCLALRADGTVVAWGDNSEGQTDVPEGLSDVIAVDAGGYSSYAVKRDGTVVAWGSNSAGQLEVPEGLMNVAAIAAGYEHVVALVGDAPPVLYPPMREPRWTPGGFTVVVSGQSGRVYRLEHRESLGTGDWQPLPLVAGRAGRLVLRDSTAGGSQRFYRVRQW